MTPAPPKPGRVPYHIFREGISPVPVRRALAVALVVLLVPAYAAAVPIAEVLGAVALNGRFPAAARADLRIERREGETTRSTRGVLAGLGRVVYVELEGGTRALIRPGKIAIAGPGAPRRAEPGAPLAGTDLLLEDLAPFTLRCLATPQISDEGPMGTVVTGAPVPPSAYVLLVLTIEEERGTIAKTQYYRDAISELAKIRRDGGFMQVDGHWRPTEVTVESFRDKTATRLTLTWRPAPAIPPARFTPAGLRGPGLLGKAH
jgi:hypothetical protein